MQSQNFSTSPVKVMSPEEEGLSTVFDKDNESKRQEEIPLDLTCHNRNKIADLSPAKRGPKLSPPSVDLNQLRNALPKIKTEKTKEKSETMRKKHPSISPNNKQPRCETRENCNGKSKEPLNPAYGPAIDWLQQTKNVQNLSRAYCRRMSPSSGSKPFPFFLQPHNFQSPENLPNQYRSEAYFDQLPAIASSSTPLAPHQASCNPVHLPFFPLFGRGAGSVSDKELEQYRKLKETIAATGSLLQQLSLQTSQSSFPLCVDSKFLPDFFDQFRENQQSPAGVEAVMKSFLMEPKNGDMQQWQKPSSVENRNLVIPKSTKNETRPEFASMERRNLSFHEYVTPPVDKYAGNAIHLFNTAKEESKRDPTNYPSNPVNSALTEISLKNKERFCNSSNTFSKQRHPRPVNFKPCKIVCVICGRTYATEGALTKHLKIHEDPSAGHSFKCKICKKACNTLGALRMHIRTHTLPCECHICGKAFSRTWLLQGHIRTHTGEKPYQCPKCSRAFADRSNLRAHMQTHEIVKRYSCKGCDKTFSRISLLKRHQRHCCDSSMMENSLRSDQQFEKEKRQDSATLRSVSSENHSSRSDKIVKTRQA